MKIMTAISLLGLFAACGAMAEPKDTPKAKCDFHLISVEEGGALGRFAFRLQEDKPIQLFGFGFTATNVFRVRFEKYDREEDGKWSRLNVGYCGTGAELHTIQPRTDYVFLVALWPFLEKGQKGVITVPGTGVSVTSAAFDTAEIRRIGAGSKKTANNTVVDSLVPRRGSASTP